MSKRFKKADRSGLMVECEALDQFEGDGDELCYRHVGCCVMRFISRKTFDMMVDAGEIQMEEGDE